jgi:hypothetical protein
MAHASKRKKKPDQAVQDIICTYLTKKGCVGFEELCASRLRRDPFFRQLLGEEPCINQQNKGLNPRIDRTVRAMQLANCIVQKEKGFVLERRPTKLLCPYRPKRGRPKPKTVKPNPKTSKQQRREFHRGPLVQV